ncbi:unnamed protein product [Clonostachys rosea]|uniref:alpha-L-rhamnosidase n=1 Tax=Bionectria ochroleuca TaxID=29856 RepID=A0ABY6U4V4_BIOOC|nr:unnamed protein product [Clonostachys rosea]
MLLTLVPPFLALIAGAVAETALVTIATITVNDLVNPLAVNSTAPKFGWTLNSPTSRGAGYQSAQIQVLSQSTTVWDSGIVSPAAPTYRYDGPALTARSDYALQIRVLDSAGTWTNWSTGSFGTGLFTESDWSSAKWIAASNAWEQPYLRTTFNVSKTISKARLYISGVGNYESYLNGKKVGDLFLTPGYTQYAVRDFYDTYDVAGQLALGTNAIGIAVGRFYVGARSFGHSSQYGAWDGSMRTKALIVISYVDGTSQTIATGDAWKVRVSGTTSSNKTPDDEYFDASNEWWDWSSPQYDVSSWSSAVVQTKSANILQSTPMEPVKIKESLTAVKIMNPTTGVWVYDFGRNIAGIGRLKVNEAINTTVTMHYAEQVNSDGRVIDKGGRWQWSTYVTAGKGTEIWLPRASYYGFRYIELKGVTTTPDEGTVTALRLHSDVRGTGWFTADNKVLQWIHDATWQTLLNNHLGQPTDGSYLEKLPWTADAALMVETSFSALNLKAQYYKWMQDIEDSGVSNGNIAPWAPSPLGMDAWPSAAWGSSYPEIAWQLYQHYADMTILETSYARIKRYVDYEYSVRNTTTGLAGWEMWGDWVAPVGVNEKTLVGTAFLYKTLTRFAQIASVLGKKGDSDTYETYSQAVNASFHDVYWQPSTGDYRNASTLVAAQTNNLLPIAFNMTSPAQRQGVVDKIATDVKAQDNHLATGLLGTKYLLPVLTDYGYIDLAYAVATQETYPSWGYWRSLGATTLWEEWPATSRSQGHGFFGTVVDWFYQHLAGIKITSPGYATISVKPYVPSSLSSAKGTVTTVRGKVESAWSKSSDGSFILSLTVPTGATARLSLPVSSGQSVYEGDSLVSSGITGVVAVNGQNEKDRSIYIVSSGTYNFTVK